METKKAILITVITAVLVSLGFYLVVRPGRGPQGVQGPEGKTYTVTKDGGGVGSAGNVYGDILTALDGISFAGRNTGGGVLRGDGMTFDLGTTTPCSIRSPIKATSTLVTFNIYVSRNATTSAREVSIATSTIPYATTSPILDGSLMSIPANTNWSLALNATTSITSASNQSRFGIFPPGTWLTVSFKGNNPAGTPARVPDQLDGTCSALWLTEGR